MTLALDAVSAYDEAFAGKSAHVVDHVGRRLPFEVERWSSAAGIVDRLLFVDPCDAATIDVGCGPGRLVAELLAKGVTALGIDASAEAVRQTRLRGGTAACGDVFGPVPDEGRWAYALLADGNVGIGGDPVALLSRVRDLLVPGGVVIVEVGDLGTGLVRGRRRIHVGGRLSAHFDWAEVGIDAIGAVATRAGLDVLGTRSIGGRHTATLGRAVA